MTLEYDARVHYNAEGGENLQELDLHLCKAEKPDLEAMYDCVLPEQRFSLHTLGVASWREVSVLISTYPSARQVTQRRKRNL